MGVSVTVDEAVLVVSACEVAVTVTLAGRPVWIVGAVYAPPEVIAPHRFAALVQETLLLRLQVTAVLLELVTVGVNVTP